MVSLLMRLLFSLHRSCIFIVSFYFSISFFIKLLILIKMVNQSLNPILDASSPYYLNPNENPVAVLVTQRLTGENYYAWARAMSMVLNTKNKLSFVDGTLLKP
ncbi:putative gag-polypeptide of LTR copia-type [Lupinus albus]|uniref:Putative gag-polypeptide of LTR copia-type n=1 Tax=Lupinus albus TaxID=3870 RepID=A0A6A4NF83_LUPAL|nr:putative gag-polypeptide of LTR copia-type [Lupinus albus]